MKVTRRVMVIILIIVVNILMGCSKDVTNNTSLELYKGSFVLEGESAINLYNLKEESIIEKVDTSDIVVTYNSLSQNYLYIKDGKYIVKYKGKEIEVVSDSVIHPKFSPDGKHLFYFTNVDYLRPIVINLENNNVKELKSNYVISGKFIDWLDNDTMLYYGIDTVNKTAGIITYNIKSEKEEIIHKLTSGYVDFLKYSNGKVLFHHVLDDSNKILYEINDTRIVNKLVDNVMELKDVIAVDQSIYIYGRMLNNVSSLYELKDGNIKRLLYDFPSVIVLDKGISEDSNGGILFIGSSNGLKEEKIYKYQDGVISVLADDIGKYFFIGIN